MDTEDVVALLGILPFGYLFFLPVYWALHKLLRKFAGLDASFWKLSIVAFIAVIPSAMLAVLAWGGDGTPPSVMTALFYILLGAVSFVVAFWLGAKLLETVVSVAGMGLAFTYMAVLLMIGVFITRSSG